MLDLVVRGTKVVTPQGVGAYDVAVQGEKIVAVAAAGTFGKETTRRLIDAGDQIVMPGGIDPHCHCAWPIPFAGKGSLSDPPSVVSRAALFGGTTTLLDFAHVSAATGVGAIREARVHAVGRARSSRMAHDDNPARQGESRGRKVYG